MTLTELNAAESETRQKKSRIRAVNEEKIIEAATEVFARYGYRGATIEQIAASAGMSKPNLLYYFASKEALYLEVLRHIYEIWLEPLRGLDVNGDPETELGNYIDRKIEHSRLYPLASRVWANEVIAGAPLLKPVLEADLRATVQKKSAVLRAWMKQGKIAEFDAEHFLFLIWTATQHYADFSTQIEAVTGKTIEDENFYRRSRENIRRILLRGIFP